MKKSVKKRGEINVKKISTEIFARKHTFSYKKRQFRNAVHVRKAGFFVHVLHNTIRKKPGPRCVHVTKKATISNDDHQPSRSRVNGSVSTITWYEMFECWTRERSNKGFDVERSCIPLTRIRYTCAPYKHTHTHVHHTYMSDSTLKRELEIPNEEVRSAAGGGISTR